MARKTDNFPLVLIGAGLGLFLLFHTVWNIVFEDWLKHELEKASGHSVAEMIERFGSIGVPLLLAVGIVWFLWRYLKYQYDMARSNRGLYVACTSVLPNMKVPAHSGTFWLDLTHPDIEHLSFGLHSQTSSHESSIASDEPGASIYQCTVTNYDPEPMVNIKLTLDIISHEATLEPNGSYKGTGAAFACAKLINIKKVDPGSDNSFVFYVKNLSPYFFQIGFQPQAAVERLGDEMIETVPVASNLSHHMLFGPHISGQL